MGALTGREDLLSGVDAIAGLDGEKTQLTLKNKTKECHELLCFVLLEHFCKMILIIAYYYYYYKNSSQHAVSELPVHFYILLSAFKYHQFSFPAYRNPFSMFSVCPKVSFPLEMSREEASSSDA